jgi:hypothetical protein
MSVRPSVWVWNIVTATGYIFVIFHIWNSYQFVDILWFWLKSDIITSWRSIYMQLWRYIAVIISCHTDELFSMKYIRAEAEAKADGLNITVVHDLLSILPFSLKVQGIRSRRLRDCDYDLWIYVAKIRRIRTVFGITWKCAFNVLASSALFPWK